MKKLLFLISICLLSLILIFKYTLINNTIFSCNIINIEDYEKIIKDKEEIKEEIVLYYNGDIIPYSKSEDFYLLSTLGDNYLGKINASKYNVVVLEDNRNKTDLMSNDSSIKLLVYDKKNYKLLNLKLSNLSVINIVNTDEKSLITIFDNITNKNDEKINIYKYNCNYHVRGATSKKYDKKSYKLNIIKENGKKDKIKFLNMRLDDDWTLNASYLDNSFMREKIGYDIWNQLDNNIKYNINYVELIIDNEYLGLYYLMEPVDMKKFNSNKTNDLLMSVNNWEFDVEQKDIFDENFQNYFLINEFEYDSGDYDNFLNILRGFISTRYGKDYKIKVDYNINNATDYELFLNLILAIDNTYKNTKVLFKNNSDGYTAYFCPWDLDWSQLNARMLVYFDINRYLDLSLLSNEFKNTDEYNNLLKDKYYKARKNFYNMDYINKLIDGYVELLSNGGAASRNSNKWGYPDFSLDVENIKSFYEERIKVLDNHFGGNNGL